MRDVRDVRPGGVQLVDRLVAGELGGVALPTRFLRALLPGEHLRFRRGRVGGRPRWGTGGVTEHGAFVEEELFERFAEIMVG